MDAHVAILKTAQRRAAGPPGGERGVERAEIGAEDLGRAHHFVKVRADDVLAAGPFAQPAVAPENRVVVAEQHDAVGHALQDALVLHEPGDVDDFGEVIGVGVDADVVAAAEMREGPNRRDIDDFARLRRTARAGRPARRACRLDRESWDVDTSLASWLQILVATQLARTQPELPRATREFSRPPSWQMDAWEAPPSLGGLSRNSPNYRCLRIIQQPAFAAECSESVLFSASAPQAIAIEVHQCDLGFFQFDRRPTPASSANVEAYPRVDRPSRHSPMPN